MKSTFFVLFCLITFGLNPLYSQENCATTIPIPIASVFGGNNLGAIIDNDYSAITACDVQNYNSSVWYSFTTPAGGANDPAVGWDGRFKDRIVMSGVYVYLIKTIDPIEGTQSLTGNITVTN